MDAASGRVGSLDQHRRAHPRSTDMNLRLVTPHGDEIRKADAGGARITRSCLPVR